MLAVAYATGRASHAREVKGDDPDKKGYPGPPGWGLGVGLRTSHSKYFIVTKVEQRNKMDRFHYEGREVYILVIARSLPALEALCIELTRK